MLNGILIVIRIGEIEMDYKKIIKNREYRIKILNLLSFIPDKIMIKIQYRLKTGRKLNLKNPQRFSEKLQLYKLNYKNNLMCTCVDKFEVRDYVMSKGLGNILNEIYGVYDKPEDIDFDKLPNQFVLKDTLGGGGNSVIIVKDKNNENISKIIEQTKKWISTSVNIKSPGRERVYDGKKHRIIIEKYLDYEDNDLPDYKFFCFNGKPFCLYYINGRTKKSGINLGIFDCNFNQMPYYIADKNILNINPSKPENFNDMLEIAKKLSEVFPHVRVDLYNIHGKIIFGEMTFFDASGYQKFSPDNFDYILGEQFKI